jgi:uncharacterized protein (UPF0179 family)
MNAKPFQTLRPLLLCIALTTVLAGCGGGDNNAPASPPPAAPAPPPPPPPAPAPSPPFSIGGTASGLSGTVVLQESTSGDSIAVTSNGAFKFPKEVAQGANYTVGVYKQPAGQTCTVSAGTGAAADDVTNIVVTCANDPLTVGGTVTGLTAPVTLQLNLGNNLTVNADSPFTFDKNLPSGADYAVTVVPSATQNCTVSNGTGTITANVGTVTVTCAAVASNLPVGGTIRGLSGQPVTLTLTSTAGTPTVTTSTNGAFDFGTTLPAGTAYLVTVTTPPTGQYCVVGDAGGVVSSSSATALTVTCANGVMPATYTVGGSVTGLTGTLQLALNQSNDLLTVNSGATSFAFPVGIPQGTDYRVTVASQPAGQTCIIPNGGTIMESSNVTGITVTCVANVTDALSGTFMRYNSRAVLTLYPDGVYVYGSLDADTTCGASNGNGIEVGAYDYDASAGTIAFISNVVDTNGSTCGMWRNGSSIVNGTLTKSGSGQNLVLVMSGANMTPAQVLVPVPSVPGTPVGSFTNGTLSFTVFMPDGHYVETNVVNDPAHNYPAGIEAGCYTRTGTSSGAITVATCTGSVDTDGSSGLSVLGGAALNYQAVGDYKVNFGNGRYIGTRIVPGK